MRTLSAAAAAVVLLASTVVAADAPRQGPAIQVGETAPMASGGVVDLSLIEALGALKKPELAGLFSFINPKDAPFAFGDMLARDGKSLKRYLYKLDDDKEAANGLSPWDHEVCAAMVNLYNSPMGASFEKPKAKLMSKINQCVLSAVVPLQEIVSRRKR